MLISNISYGEKRDAWRQAKQRHQKAGKSAAAAGGAAARRGRYQRGISMFAGLSHSRMAAWNVRITVHRTSRKMLRAARRTACALLRRRAWLNAHRVGRWQIFSYCYIDIKMKNGVCCALSIDMRGA